MIYVALLRGINVGGKARVEMARLKDCFETAGFTNVKTYINSGNVIFSSDKKEPELQALIEKIIAKEFGFAVPVVVRNQKILKLSAKKTPKDWTNGEGQKTDVMFLWNEVNNKKILQQVVIKPEFESVLYVDGALIWNTLRENVSRGGMLKLIGTALYKQMTIRNINTVCKLRELMIEAEN